MSKLVLTQREIIEIEQLLSYIGGEYEYSESNKFIRNCKYHAYQLPKRLVSHLEDFSVEKDSRGACVISGLPIDQKKIGPTSLDACLDNSITTQREHVFLLMTSSLLGEVFGWRTQQNAKIVHDILPMKEHVDEQIGSGSNEYITLHCEDAFHECRADYLGLMCLRNPQRAPTTYSFLKEGDLTDSEKALLFQPEYVIRPDNSHIPENNETDKRESLDPAFLKIKEQLSQGIKIAPLFGDFESPYLRLDPYFMDEPKDDARKAAFNKLCISLERNKSKVLLSDGDIVFVDNYRVLHGREPFKANFDGNDRWLKRVNITRDLRRSRGMRASAECRIVC